MSAKSFIPISGKEKYIVYKIQRIRGDLDLQVGDIVCLFCDNITYKYGIMCGKRLRISPSKGDILYLYRDTH